MFRRSYQFICVFVLFLLCFSLSIAKAQSYSVEGLRSGPLAGQDGWTGSGDITVDNTLFSPMDGSKQSIRLRGQQNFGIVSRSLGTTINSGKFLISYDLYITPRVSSNQVMRVGFNDTFVPYAQDGGAGIAQNGIVDTDGLGSAPFQGLGDIVTLGFRYHANKWYRFEFLLDFDQAQVRDLKIYDISGGSLQLIASGNRTFYFRNDGVTYNRDWNSLTLIMDPATSAEGWNFDNFRVTPFPPTAPSALSAIPVPSRAIKLHWQDNSNDEKGFLIEETDEAGKTITLPPVPANTEEYIVSGLQHNQEYSFRVCAFNDAGKSAFRNSVSARAQTYVLLVHGIYGNSGTIPGGYWYDMNRELNNGGYHIDTIDFSAYASTGHSNDGPIAGQGNALSDKITHILDANPDGDLDVVAHSMGGLATRYYLNNIEGDMWPLDTKGNPHAGVRKLITLGTPHWGTDIELADPIGAVFQARASHKTDTIFNWSNALQDMYAEWMVPPTKVAPNTPYFYPADYKFSMGRWPISGKNGSPIHSDDNLAFFNTAKFLLLDFDGLKTVKMTQDDFPRTAPATRMYNHVAYYNQYKNTLGPIIFPAVSAPVEGVNTRRISQFMYDLNVASTNEAGTKIYLAVGTSPYLFFIPGVVSLIGPYPVPGLPSDGVVPGLSASGVDPILGISLFPGRPVQIFPYSHNDLKSKPSVLSQVKLWLQE